jgi:uncharacterized membrane protein YesL
MGKPYMGDKIFLINQITFMKSNAEYFGALHLLLYFDFTTPRLQRGVSFLEFVTQCYSLFFLFVFVLLNRYLVHYKCKSIYPSLQTRGS